MWSTCFSSQRTMLLSLLLAREMKSEFGATWVRNYSRLNFSNKTRQTTRNATALSWWPMESQSWVAGQMAKWDHSCHRAGNCCGASTVLMLQITLTTQASWSCARQMTASMSSPAVLTERSSYGASTIKSRSSNQSKKFILRKWQGSKWLDMTPLPLQVSMAPSSSGKSRSFKASWRSATSRSLLKMEVFSASYITRTPTSWFASTRLGSCHILIWTRWSSQSK